MKSFRRGAPAAIVAIAMLASSSVALPQPEYRQSTSGRPKLSTYPSDVKFAMLSSAASKAVSHSAGTTTTAATTTGATTEREISSTFSNSTSLSFETTSGKASVHVRSTAGTTTFATSTPTTRTTTRTTSRTTSKSTSTGSGSKSASKGTGASSTVASTAGTTSASTVPTDTSSRTVPQDVTTFLPSSRKSTSSATEYTTTSASISAKETRESPGKIRPQIKLTTNYTSVSETGVRLPEGASAALAKPTKYHYYPHNQHIYLLPECAVQQVCNAVYVRLNFTQPLCACPGRYRDPCSASLDSDDLHTTELVTDPRTKALTLVKTCEPVAEMRECRTPRDWSLLALQNVRTGKSHYLVICRCPDANILEGPMSHDQPTYASVPGIRVYGMMCVQGNRRGRPLRYRRSPLGEAEERSREDSSYAETEEEDRLRFPWHKVQQLTESVVWD